jgi:hypothetical protein
MKDWLYKIPVFPYLIFVLYVLWSELGSSSPPYSLSRKRKIAQVKSEVKELKFWIIFSDSVNFYIQRVPVFGFTGLARWIRDCWIE